MIPSRASTSRTSVPLARPPMLGLQLISPMEAAGDGVTSTVAAPRLAEAAAASHPAWPPPTTTTSQLSWASALKARRIAGGALWTHAEAATLRAICMPARVDRQSIAQRADSKLVGLLQLRHVGRAGGESVPGGPPRAITHFKSIGERQDRISAPRAGTKSWRAIFVARWLSPGSLLRSGA